MAIDWTEATADWLRLLTLAIAAGFLLYELGIMTLGYGGLILAGGYACGFILCGTIGWKSAAAIVAITIVLMAAGQLRVKADIFALVTLSLGQLVFHTAVGAINLTGGNMGLGPIPRSDWVASDEGSLVISGTLAAVAAAAYAVATATRLGVSLGAIRDQELAARAYGVAVVRIGFVALLAVGLVTVAAGAVQALAFGLVSPTMGSIDITLQVLAAVMLARPLWRQGRPQWVLLGYAGSAAVLVLAPPLLRRILPEQAGIDVIRQAILGVLLYALVHPRVTTPLRAEDGLS
jgi:branched-chain amino acid transport system permease protein